MDCCNTKDKEGCCGDLDRINFFKSNHSDSKKSDKLKGGKKMKIEKRLLLWGVIAVLFVAALFLTFQAGVTSAGGAVQTTTTVAKSAASSYSGMVGGC